MAPVITDDGIGRPDPVDHSLGPRGMLPGFGDQINNAGEGRVGHHLGDADLQSPVEVLRTREHAVVDAAVARQGFAGDGGFVDGGRAANDLTVNGNLFARPHQNDSADAYLPKRDTPRHFAIDQCCLFRRQLAQRDNGRLRAPQRVALHCARKREQKQQQRALERAADISGQARAEQHQQVDIDSQVAEFSPDIGQRRNAGHRERDHHEDVRRRAATASRSTAPTRPRPRPFSHRRSTSAAIAGGATRAGARVS